MRVRITRVTWQSARGSVFGLGRNDATQVAAVQKFRESLAEVRGGYVFPLGRGEDPVLLTVAQRDVLVDDYADHMHRAMWWVMILTLGGTVAILAIILSLDMEVQFWMILPIIAVALVPTLTIRWPLRRRIESFGLLPRVPSQEYAFIQRERLKERPWSAILLPALVLPVLALNLNPHIPPAKADDWVESAFILAIAGVFVWAAARKLLAGRRQDL